MIETFLGDAGAGLFTADERQFRAELRQWLAEHPPPDASGAGLQHEVLPAQIEWERELNGAGFGGLHWPVEFGGQARSMTYQLILAEEMAGAQVMPFRHRPTIVGMFMAGPFIIALGSEQQQRRYLPRILGLDDLWCQLFSEPDAGSDLASLRTVASREGDHFIVNGQKVWNSYAHIADMGVLLARTSTGASKHDGLTCFLLDMRSPGITVRPLRQANGGTEFNEVYFDGVVVPDDAVIGGVDQGWRAITTFLANERSALQLGSYAEMLLAAQRLLDSARDAERGSPRRQDAVAAWTGLMVQRWTALAVASHAERGSPSTARAALGKLQWAMNLQRLAATDIALRGAAAMAWDSSDEDAAAATHALLSSRSASIAGGTSEVQKNLIGERVLGLPRG